MIINKTKTPDKRLRPELAMAYFKLVDEIGSMEECNKELAKKILDTAKYVCFDAPEDNYLELHSMLYNLLTELGLRCPLDDPMQTAVYMKNIRLISRLGEELL